MWIKASDLDKGKNVKSSDHNMGRRKGGIMDLGGDKDNIGWW